MNKGLFEASDEGTPQGGSLCSMLSNVMPPYCGRGTMMCYIYGNKIRGLVLILFVLLFKYSVESIAQCLFVVNCLANYFELTFIGGIWHPQPYVSM